MSKVVAKTVSVQNSAGTATTDITFDGTKLVSTALDNSITDKANTYDLGVGQTWQDVTASRALGVTYTNSTGKPIVVAIYAYGSTAQTNIIGILNGNHVHAITFGTGVDTSGFTIVVPNNASYSAVNHNAVSFTGFGWSELR